jgi:diguanylate cyclase
MKSLDEELIRAQRDGPPCCVALIDLDFFKRINDKFGHPVGDEALRTFAMALLANIRTIDRLGRYGGEEFLLIMPDTPANEAVRTLERLRMTIAELNWAAIAENMHLTMSAGVCAVRHGASPDDILARADAALYRAKDAGRNCVMTA